MNNIKPIVYQTLPDGKNNGYSAKLLCSLLGFANERALQRRIHIERVSGYPICSTHDCDSKGYYKPNTPQELQEYINMMENSANSQKRAIAPAKRILKDWVNGGNPLDELNTQ